ncbi:MAG: radical SAM protein [candidate division KSB1 bacterium]|nr:radical SAM protein [candidate division KSB1 bacterium]MDZ7300456.1 radical SAM protein [candidate division KSB1 bacterium]MDZ7308634.1 radical SAM protein [candidate division KSB1 bacterium]MDZ7351442.1 radical SAM protein [candidate division KSB1 bacterium]MDZ7355801.1 radical SAM protein [candidate division KSB1 bacterium]
MSTLHHDIYVGYYAWPITVLGPGRRVGLWLTGCTLHCPGCMSPHFFVRRPEQRLPVAALLAKLRPGLRECDGLTVSGGEPFEQSAALAALLQGVAAEFPDRDVLVYSGFTIEEIWRDPDKRAVLRWIDLLMDGRFEVGTSHEKIWRGSDNQRLLLLSERAQKYAAFCQAKSPARRLLQLQWLGDGKVSLIGLPARGVTAALRRKLRAALPSDEAEVKQD